MVNSLSLVPMLDGEDVEAVASTGMGFIRATAHPLYGMKTSAVDLSDGFILFHKKHASLELCTFNTRMRAREGVVARST